MSILSTSYRKIVSAVLLLSWSFFLVYVDPVFAITAEDQYYRAENCYKKLRNDSNKRKYRHHWLSCIEQFNKVFRKDPAGPWAPAGLYMSGTLYLNLYRYSNKSGDKKEALDLFQRIIKRFPHSGYAPKAAQAVRRITESESKSHSSGKTASKSAVTPNTSPKGNEDYFQAEACYQKLDSSPKKQKYRHHWQPCIDKFQDAYRKDPSGPWAAASLYMTGVLYRDLYRHSYKTSDKADALKYLQQVMELYPGSAYVPKSLSVVRQLSPEIADKWVAEQKKDALKKEAAATKKPLVPSSPAANLSASAESPSLDDVFRSESAGAAPMGDGESIVTGLRYWSNPNYTRVVIDADRETTYDHLFLKKDPSIQKPQRLVVDINNSRLKQDIEKAIPVDDNLLSAIRAGQNTSDMVRVVVDIKSSKRYKIFSLKNPFRVVIDVWGLETGESQSEEQPFLATKGEALSREALAKQLVLGVRRIVIDPGHGGKDYGAPGYLKGVHEKDVILKISKRLAQMIREKLHCDVVLTRDTDNFLTLEERTAIANTLNADLFISMHANSSRDKTAYGIETYFLNLATDNDAIMVAATENATSTKNISDLQMILSDLMQNAKINESSRLAAHVQDALYCNLKGKYSRIKNKGVKQAPFYVLLGAQMPAVLIEASFISNKLECERLINESYQEKICEGIVTGIRNYVKEINPMAFYDKSSAG